MDFGGAVFIIGVGKTEQNVRLPFSINFMQDLTQAIVPLHAHECQRDRR